MSDENEPDLLTRIFRQRRRIRTRLNTASDSWPLKDYDRTELEAINALFADVEKAIGVAPSAPTVGEKTP